MNASICLKSSDGVMILILMNCLLLPKNYAKRLLPPVGTSILKTPRTYASIALGTSPIANFAQLLDPCKRAFRWKLSCCYFQTASADDSLLQEEARGRRQLAFKNTKGPKKR